ncbi:MAG: helix-turn-helix transcriptional regulator [Sphingomonadales bacterium]|nr:helix-turn-helix transcriptional regulator [Sphingomonadales bacterium]
MRLFAPDRTFGFQSAAAVSAHETNFHEPGLEVSLILEGGLTFFVDGKKRVVEGPCATFQAYRRTLDVVVPSGRRTRTMWCHVSPADLSEAEWQWVNQLPPVQKMSHLLPSLFQGALSLPERDDGAAGQDFDRDVRNALGAAIFSEYVRSAKPSGGARPMPLPVALAKRALDSDYARRWSLEELAKLTETNANHLIYLFKRHIGDSPMRYLWDRRVDEGVHLLRTTDLTRTKSPIDAASRLPRISPGV